MNTIVIRVPDEFLTPHYRAEMERDDLSRLMLEQTVQCQIPECTTEAAGVILFCDPLHTTCRGLAMCIIHERANNLEEEML